MNCTVRIVVSAGALAEVHVKPSKRSALRFANDNIRQSVNTREAQDKHI